MSIFLQADFMKGMNYAGFDRDVFASPESDQAIDALLLTGVNWVAVNVLWYQDTGSSIEIKPHEQKTVSDASLDHLIDYLQNKKIAILLKPMVDARDHTWRGQFAPEDREAWFDSYTKFILHYARIAEEKRLELFSIGCEFPMGNAEEQSHWLSLIEKVRSVYSGKLTYAANFNKKGSYKRVRFWDVLDYIGIDAYFSVSGRRRNSVRRMQRGWNRWIRRIERWYGRKDHSIPVLFTELGATSVRGGARRPWAYDQTSEPNWAEQAAYYEAFFNSFENRPWLKGSFWWWWDNPSTSDYIKREEGDYARFYTPKGKDAQEVLGRYYGIA